MKEFASHKNWKCPKCEETYNSPIKVTAVRCAQCSRSLSKRETWMKPVEDS